MPLLIFSTRLRYLMETEKISKRGLSIKAKIERKSITNYVNGIFLPRYDTLARIADFFEVSTDYLLGLEEENIYCYQTSCDITDIPHLFVSRLKDLMLQENLSQGKLAKKLNMQQAGISKWLRMKTMPETFVLMDLAKVFDCSVDFLIGRERK